MSQFWAVWDLDTAGFEAEVAARRAARQRLVQVDLAGDPADPRYATVWVPDGGVEWREVHGVNAASLQRTLDEGKHDGLVATALSATGPATGAVFAAVLERRHVRGWYALVDLVWGSKDEFGSLVNVNQVRAKESGYVPRALVAYGTPANRCFAGIWWHDESVPVWSWGFFRRDDYRRVKNALAPVSVRPAVAAATEEGTVIAAFTDDRVGSFRTRVAVPADQLKAVLDAETQAGRRPVALSRGGTGDDLWYTLATAAAPIRRQWSATDRTAPPVGPSGPFGPGTRGPLPGDAGPGPDVTSGTLATDLDDAMQAWMRATGVRNASIAVARAGTVLVSRAYTWAEPDVPATTVDTVFRLASVSKLFTAAAVEALAADGALDLDARAFELLGVTTPLPTSTTPDARTASVTVAQLLNRRSGLPHDVDWAAVETAADARPPTQDDVVRWIYGLPLDRDPGADPGDSGSGYSNGALMVAGAVVEKVSGQTLVDYVSARLLPDTGGELYVAPTAAPALPREVSRYWDAAWGTSLLDASGDTLPAAYGGAFLLEPSPGSGGLACDAATVARFIGSHAVWDSGAHSAGLRYGSLAGTGAIAYCRADGLDVAVLTNRATRDRQKEDLVVRLDRVLDASGLARG